MYIENYTSPECTNKPGYEGTFFVWSKKGAISINWISKLKQILLKGKRKWIA